MAGLVEGSSYEPDRRARRVVGPVFGLACLVATSTGVVVLSVMLGAVIGAVVRDPGHRPIGATLLHLLTHLQSSDPAIAGFRAGVAGSLWLLGLVALFAIPVGVGAAVFLEEYVPPGRFRRIIQLNIANLAGVPSIVYGILGLAVFVRAFGARSLALGPTLWAGALTLGLLILPGDRDRHAGGAPDRPRVAPPGGDGAGGEPVAGDPRPRPADRPSRGSRRG